MVRNYYNNWIVKAGGNRYRHVNGYRAVELINKCLGDYATPLSENQARVLRREFGDSGMLGNLDMPFQVLEWEDRKPTGVNVWWRMSLPLLLLWGCVKYIIIESLHWVFTGNRDFGPRATINVLSSRWVDNCLGR